MSEVITLEKLAEIVETNKAKLHHIEYRKEYHKKAYHTVHKLDSVRMQKRRQKSLEYYHKKKNDETFMEAQRKRYKAWRKKNRRKTYKRKVSSILKHRESVKLRYHAVLKHNPIYMEERNRRKRERRLEAKISSKVDK